MALLGGELQPPWPLDQVFLLIPLDQVFSPFLNPSLIHILSPFALSRNQVPSFYSLFNHALLLCHDITFPVFTGALFMLLH